MGLFSSKKKVKVNTTVQRVVDDHLIPQSVKAGTIKAVIDDGSITEYVLEEVVQSITFKAERMFEYAEKGNHPYGIPRGSIVASNQGAEAVRVFLETQVQQPVSLDYYEFAPINASHAGWFLLQEEHGYIAGTNMLMNLTREMGFPVYLKDMVSVYTPSTVDELEDGIADTLGPDPSRGYIPGQRLAEYRDLSRRDDLGFDIDAASNEDYVRVIYTYRKEIYEGNVLRYEWVVDSFDMSLSRFDEDREYHHVRYRYGGQSKYWLYADGSGEFPEVDAIMDIDYADFGHYMPFIYFRVDGASLEGASFDANTKLMKYLGVDYPAMYDAIHENPGIDDLMQAFMVMGVPAQTSNPIERRYLFEYFNALFMASDNAAPLQSFQSSFSPYTSRASNSILIQDNAFKMTLTYSGISRHRLAGSIGKKGTYDSGMGGNYHYYRCQVSPTLYDEIRVYSLTMRYHIAGKYSTTGSGAEAELLIPLDMGIINTIPMPKREELYTRSMHFVFNTYVETKVKWYASGWFKWVLVIILIIVTIVTGNGYQGIPAILAAGGIAALAWVVVVAIVKMVVVQIAVKLFIKAVGEKFAIIVAILTVIAVMTGNVGAATEAAGGATSAAAATTTEISFKGFLAEMSKMTATQMLSACTNIISTSLSGIQQGLMSDLEKQYAGFNEYKDQSTQMLEEAQKLLQVDAWVDPFMFIGQAPRVVFGESPQDYYTRTIHSGNIGALGPDVIENYVGVALKLPSANSTLDGWGGQVMA